MLSILSLAHKPKQSSVLPVYCQHSSSGGGHSGIFPKVNMGALKACRSSSLHLNAEDAAAAIPTATWLVCKNEKMTTNSGCAHISVKTYCDSIDLMQIWWLLISINWISLTKEMNPITRKSVSKLVAKHTRNGRHLKTPKIRDKCMVVRSRVWIPLEPQNVLSLSLLFCMNSVGRTDI